MHLETLKTKTPHFGEIIILSQSIPRPIPYNFSFNDLISFIFHFIVAQVKTKRMECRTARPKTNSDNTLGEQSRPNKGHL
jgi:hypothetical protein